MGTYIIHFDDKPWEDLDDEQYYRCKEIPWFSTTKTTISRLTPYTEPDMEQVRKEAYQKGLSDAWEAARTLWNTPNRKKIFGHTSFNTVFTTLTAQETIEKIRQYEQEKEMDGLRQNIQTIIDQCGYSLDEIATVLQKMKES